jgi:hypothetical protein
MTLDSFLDCDCVQPNQSQSHPTEREGWIIDKSQRTHEDFTEYLTSHLVVCLEMELNYKTGIRSSLIDSVAVDEFGVSTDWMSACPVCGFDGCTSHDPPKTIRKIKCDPTIRGKEILIWGSPIPSEEFVRRLPLENIKKYFVPRPQDSLHTHTLIPQQQRSIPIQIAQNAWEFFRAYYPAWVHIFGNYRRHYLRSWWAQFRSYETNLLDLDNWPEVSQKFQGGLHFENCSRDNFGDITHFDAEIRTQDASTDLEQVVSARALSKAIFLKSAQLATEGVIEMPVKKKAIILPLIEELNRGCVNHRRPDFYGHTKQSFDLTLEERHGSFMRGLAEEFFSQVKPFLSEFEARCVTNCIVNPIRHRRPKFA